MGECSANTAKLEGVLAGGGRGFLPGGGSPYSHRNLQNPSSRKGALVPQELG